MALRKDTADFNYEVTYVISVRHMIILVTMFSVNWTYFITIFKRRKVILAYKLKSEPPRAVSGREETLLDS